LARSNASKLSSPLTTAQRFGSLIKSARDIMRKDQGINGDLDHAELAINLAGSMATFWEARKAPGAK
jgi:hypothetical protein